MEILNWEQWQSLGKSRKLDDIFNFLSSAVVLNSSPYLGTVTQGAEWASFTKFSDFFFFFFNFYWLLARPAWKICIYLF